MLLLLGLLLLSRFTFSQTGTLSNKALALQASSEEELELYLRIISATDPHEILHMVDLFTSSYPKSELLGIAYQYDMHAYESLGDFDGMVAAGKKALAANSGNLNTLLTLAPALANHAAAQSEDRTRMLDDAERYARAALIGIDKVRPPRDVPLDLWKSQSSAMRCKVHEALGVVAVSRKQTGAAIEEFQTAIKLSLTPIGSQYFRLGVALALDGRRKEAEKSFEQAVALGPPVVSSLAGAELQKLRAAAAVP